MARWPDFDTEYESNDRQFPPPYRDTGWFKRASGGYEAKYHSALWDQRIRGWVAFCAYLQGHGNVLDHQGQDARDLDDTAFMATTCRICHRFRDNKINIVPPTYEYTNTYPYLGPTQIEDLVRRYAKGPRVGSRPVVFTMEEVTRMDVLPPEGHFDVRVNPQLETVTFLPNSPQPIGAALHGAKAGQLVTVDMTTGKITPVQESKMNRTAPRTIEQEARDLKNAARDLYIQAQILESLPAEPEENTVAFTIRYPDTTSEDGERVYEFLALRADNGEWYTTATGTRGQRNRFGSWDALIRWWQDEGGDGPIFRATKWRELDV